MTRSSSSLVLLFAGGVLTLLAGINFGEAQAAPPDVPCSKVLWWVKPGQSQVGLWSDAAEIIRIGDRLVGIHSGHFIPNAQAIHPKVRLVIFDVAKVREPHVMRWLHVNRALSHFEADWGRFENLVGKDAILFSVEIPRQNEESGPHVLDLGGRSWTFWVRGFSGGQSGHFAFSQATSESRSVVTARTRHPHPTMSTRWPRD